ncbi:MAG: UDP-3-O-(3-hydroxymyristoyl)glucosamine N-acyltransferase [Holosporaceae bacterium]|jgi:UDP-3-O-[3-hydroxymyristoyl] glucosamine N-acyltransferase|nr:UDP-3-O-(3-hydroxymyristoyl)glucosamine N-acyltransferase [Holosporaceae bacterium]
MVDELFFGSIKKIWVKELADIEGFQIVGGKDFQILGIAPLKKAKARDLAFLTNKKYVSDLKATSAGAVIVTENNIGDLPDGVMGLVCPNVQIGYAKATNILYPDGKICGGICDSAKIHPSVILGKNCFIGENVVIEENVIIGDDVYIGAGTIIERRCRIGQGCRIRCNVSISYSIIGNNVQINSGARIGEPGFGIIPTEKEMIYVRQLGRVVIGDRVRVGANTTIDRGSVEDTVIGDDTIIDNLVQIAHNVRIGKRSIIVAQTGIAGSTMIGRGVTLAGQVGVVGHIEIGDGVVAAAKSGITSSVAAGKVVGGIPAVGIDTWKRQAAFLKMSVEKRKEKKMEEE